MAAAKVEAAQILNFNVGVLGHVDSGKTSLSKSLSTVASTASFDKNPQSKERGITLDLGFSSFVVDIPEHLSQHLQAYNMLQYTLVDCPGHASLIKTIIGGAQIIDMMILVVDIVKGMQTQTAECLVIGEILCEKMVVVLNKVDLIEQAKRQSTVEKMKKRMLKTLENTRFANSPIIAVAAKPGGPDAPETDAIGVKELIDCLNTHVYFPKRDPSGSFIYSVDHCFSIRGQGTVMTGTILNGTVNVNDTVEIPSMKVTKKVKSMQMFRKPIQKASQGDRVGICVTQFDPKQLERGLVCTPNALPTIFGAVARVHKIPYFKGKCETKSKFHLTIGHDTVMAKLLFFGPPPGMEAEYGSDLDFDKEYIYQEELLDSTKVISQKSGVTPLLQFVLVELERPVTCAIDSLVIGSRLDTDINLYTCRLSFHGKLIEAFSDKDYNVNFLPKLKIFKTKGKEGIVERIADDYSVIVKSLFKKETNLQTFTNLKVQLSSGETGVIEGSFGQSGKVKVRIPTGLTLATKGALGTTQKKKGKGKQDAAQASTPENAETSGPIKVALEFKKYIFDTKHKIIQS